MKLINRFESVENFDWVMRQSELLKIKIETNIWETWRDKPFYDISTYGLGENIKVFGRGSDQSPIVATLKSFCEYLERLTCLNLKISSSGTAVHFDKMEAIANASRELIERHIILFHINENIPFNQVSYTPRFLEKYKDELDCSFYSTGSCNGSFVYIIRGKLKKRNGVIYITGSKLDLNLEIQFLRKFVSLYELGFDAENLIQKNCLEDEAFEFKNLFNQRKEIRVNECLNLKTEVTNCLDLDKVFFARATSEKAICITSSGFHFIG